MDRRVNELISEVMRLSGRSYLNVIKWVEGHRPLPEIFIAGLATKMGWDVNRALDIDVLPSDL